MAQTTDEGNEYGEFAGEEQQKEETKSEELSTIGEESDDDYEHSEIKTDFSDLKMLTPDEVDDWQISVIFYHNLVFIVRKLFIQGTKINYALEFPDLI